MKFRFDTALATSMFALAATACTDPRPFDGPATHEAHWGPLTVEPGQEDTRCVVVKLDNALEVKIHAMKNIISAGSHHLIVYRDASATAENLVPTHCSPFAGALAAGTTGTSPIMITQKHSDELTLPPGVAYTFAPGQFVRLEMHFINTTDAPINVEATTQFMTADPNDVKYEADFMFIGTPDINLAPGAISTTRSYLPLRSEFEGVNIFAITGHTHQFGTDMQVGYSTARGMPVTSVYKPTAFAWGEPETTLQDPPFKVPTGGGFDFQCAYHNTSNTTVKFGESANEEMCFFWAYYFPSRGAQVCAHTDDIGGAQGLDICCPADGKVVCDKLLNN
jgi:hypothetical protein